MTTLDCVDAPNAAPVAAPVAGRNAAFKPLISVSLLIVSTVVSSAAEASWVTYTRDSDFGFGNFGTGGDATAVLDLIDNFGGNLTDFAAFTAGRIAVIQRGGGVDFSAKVYNAQLAGAVAAIILDAPPIGNLGMGAGDYAALVAIPSVRISQTLGDALRLELESPHLPITFHVRVVFDPTGAVDSQLERFVADTSPVPEPGGLTLALIALTTVGGAAWRRRRASASHFDGPQRSSRRVAKATRNSPP
jgi:hypothetical protein